MGKEGYIPKRRLWTGNSDQQMIGAVHLDDPNRCYFCPDYTQGLPCGVPWYVDHCLCTFFVHYLSMNLFFQAIRCLSSATAGSEHGKGPTSAKYFSTEVALSHPEVVDNLYRYFIFLSAAANDEILYQQTSCNIKMYAAFIASRLYSRPFSVSMNPKNPHALSNLLMTHVLDLWCSDGGRFVFGGRCRNKNEYIAILAFETPTHYVGSLVPLGTRRIGEAKNPGPSSNYLNIVMIYIISLASKQDEVVILTLTHKDHFNADVEKATTFETKGTWFRFGPQNSFGSNWSLPGLLGKTNSDRQDSKRGCVEGGMVSLFRPCCRSCDILPIPWGKSIRTVHSFAQLGHFWIHILVHYDLVMTNKGAVGYIVSSCSQAHVQSKCLSESTSYIGCRLYNHFFHVTLNAKNLHTPSKPLMTHVFDLWCSDGRRIVLGERSISKPECIAFLASDILIHCFDPILPLGTRRIGEAQNPGPSSNYVNIAAINPTSLANKQDEFAILTQTHNVHIIAAAETTATIETQKTFTRVVQKHGFSSIWSPPVSPQKTRLDGQASRRGRVGGVALFSRFPCRRSWDILPKPWDTSTRIVHSLVQLGHLWIQVFVLYGLAMPNKGAKEFTDNLFHQAYEQSKCLPFPTIYIGDFNHDIHTLADYPWLSELGYQSLQQIFKNKYSKDMPCTCKEATTPDTALISPELVPLVESITVIKTGLFDTHDPVIFQIAVPEHQLFRHKILLPHSLSDFPIEKSDLEDILGQNQCHDISDMQQWGQKIEHTADAVLKRDHRKNPNIAITQRLPNRCKGRCKPISMKQCPIPGPVKKAWNGHYNPTQETHTIFYKRMVRQLRRITSLKRRVFQLDLYSEIWHRTIQDIQTEWNVISNAVFHGLPHWIWINSIPELQPVPIDFPTYQWLDLLEQFVKIEVEKIAFDDRAIQHKIQAFRHHIDCKDANKSEAFARVKGTQVKPFNRTKTDITEEGYIAATSTEKVYEVYVSHPEEYHIFMPIQVDHQAARLIGKDDDALIVEFAQLHQPTKELVEVSQIIEHYDLPVIFDQLWQYWNQFWNRDKDEPDYEIAVDPYLKSLQDALPLLPDFPTFASNDLVLWKAAIKKSKIRSAPGCDGVTFSDMKILPDQLIQQLADLIEEQGYPNYLLCARTIPLPKTDGIPSPGDSRPITILPTTYRLWSRVVSNKILCYLGQILPPQITGMLPGRGAATASYDFQVLLEISKKRVQKLTGITLDLRKCFNLIHRKKVQQLMLAWGIPATLVDRWFESLKHIRRFWDIQNCCSDLQYATTGCPEGDSWSVIAMLTIAATWAHTLCSLHPTLDATAYADNWTWWSPDINQHEACIAHTIKFTQWLGLQIDWRKTWRWSTDRSQVDALDAILKPHTQGISVEAPPSTWDLGAPVGYRGHTKLGKIQERFKNGHNRLARIRSAPWDLTTKAQIVVASVYSLVFYASESVVIGQSHLESFRSAVADSLLGKESRSASPVLVLHCADRTLLDPCLFVILRALKEARRYLFRCNLVQKKEFLILASRPQHVVGYSYGPASALREYLLRVGWYLDKDGNLGVTSHLTFNILEVSFKRIKEFLVLEWQKHSIQIHTQRTHLFSFPPVSRNDTIKLLAKFPNKKRLDLLKEICGAFQTRHQQSQWDSTISSNCEFCGTDIDTKKHRLLICPTFQEHRKMYQDLVDEILDNDEVLTELPVMFQRPLADFKIALHFAEPEAIVPENIVQMLQETSAVRHFYSDGSCQFQHSPSTRFAAYSLVADLCTCDNMRAQQASLFLVTGKTPDTLQRIGIARCGGEQHIGRAELWPITIAFENFDNFIIHTDSAYCVDLLEKIKHGHSLAEFVDHNEFDLVRRIFSQRHGNKQVLKVAAHKNPRDISDSLQRYHCLGNALANDAAIEMCLHGDTSITEQFRSFHQQHTLQEAKLAQLFDLHLKLQAGRAQVASSQETQLKDLVVDTAKVSQLDGAIRQWCPQGQLWKPPDVVTRQWLEFSAWGQQVSFVVLQWILNLSWGTTNAGPNGFQMGLSWTEVALSLCLSLGAWLPIRRRNADDVETLIHPLDTAMAKSWGVTLSEMSQNAYLLVTQVQTLVPERILPPDIPIGKCNSLVLQGYHAWTTGFKQRPKFPYQSEVFGIIQKLFQGESKALQGLPDLVHSNIFQSWNADDDASTDWVRRYKKAHSTAKVVARQRMK